ncbi:MAG: hypothetical protein WD448_01885 [Woeseia sp.]
MVILSVSKTGHSDLIHRVADAVDSRAPRTQVDPLATADALNVSVRRAAAPSVIAFEVAVVRYATQGVLVAEI